jgi:hypothetical protein
MHHDVIRTTYTEKSGFILTILEAMLCKRKTMYKAIFCGLQVSETWVGISIIHSVHVHDNFAKSWTIGVLGFDCWWAQGIFLFTTAPRTALGPTQPPIQWIPGALSLEIKRLGREADHSHPSSAEVKEWVELYLHSPNMPSWRGAQLKAQGQLDEDGWDRPTTWNVWVRQR